MDGWKFNDNIGSQRQMPRRLQFRRPSGGRVGLQWRSESAIHAHIMGRAANDSVDGPPFSLSYAQAAEAACSNIWGRMLANGDKVLAFVNNGASAANVTCGVD